MSQENEVTWFCVSCLSDQWDEIWDHWDRESGEAICALCKIERGKGQNDIQSDTTWRPASHELLPAPPRNAA